MKAIANCISISRIFLVLILVFTRPFSVFFYVIYLTCGVSDMFDGYIARKLGTESKLGEKLDSAADLIMVAVVIMILYPVISIPALISYWIIGIVVIRLISMILVFMKYRTFGILHTVSNKITGLMLFTFPLFIHLHVFIYLLCMVGSISAIEELCIHLFSKEYDGNKKSIFHRRRRLD